MVSVLSPGMANFNIVGKRPAFRLGETTISEPLKSIPELRRTLPVKVWIDPPFKIAKMRPSFKLAAPGPRKPLGVDETTSLLEKQEGIKISLGESTLDALLQVEVPQKNPVDGSILLDSNGNPIMIKKRINIGKLQQRSEELLDEIKAGITNIGAASFAEKQELALAIGAVLQRAIATQELGEINTQSLLAMETAVKAMGISRDPERIGINLIDRRFVDAREWKQNGSLIIMFLLANLPPPGTDILTAQTPLFGLPNLRTGRIGPIQLGSIASTFSTGAASIPPQNRVIDLITKRFFHTLEEAGQILSVSIPQPIVAPTEEKQFAPGPPGQTAFPLETPIPTISQLSAAVLAASSPAVQVIQRQLQQQGAPDDDDLLS